MVGLEALIESAAEPIRAAEPTAKLRTFSSVRANYELLPLPGKGVEVKMLGKGSLLHGGFDGVESSQPQRFDGQTVAIGVGALGTTLADCAPRFGEFLAAGGVSVFQPADGSVRPDFSVSEGALVPEGHLLLGLVGRGDFSLLARFEHREDARAVGLGELAATALELAGTSAAVIVAVTETAGLVGATLRQSPAAAPADNFIVGVVAREGSALQPLLRPLAPGLQGHFHAASFSYRPLQKGLIDLKPTLAALFEGKAAQAVLHLLHDSREFTGAGESEFLRGALWIAPIL
jgi:hypothetical protein